MRVIFSMLAVFSTILSSCGEDQAILPLDRFQESDPIAKCKCSPDFYFEKVDGEAFVIFFDPISSPSGFSIIGVNCRADERFAKLDPQSVKVLLEAIGSDDNGTPRYGTYAVDLAAEPSSFAESQGRRQLTVVRVFRVKMLDIVNYAQDLRESGQCDS